MNWDEKITAEADEYSNQLGECGAFGDGAEWVLHQLRTDEAVERAARALFEVETELDWEHAAQWVQDDYRLFARTAIDGLLGED